MSASKASRLIEFGQSGKKLSEILNQLPMRCQTSSESPLEVTSGKDPVAIEPRDRHVPASPASAGLSEEDVTEVYWTPAISPGLAMWVEVDLEPGTYAAICFIPAPDGTPHVMLGMVEIFTVE